MYQASLGIEGETLPHVRSVPALIGTRVQSPGGDELGKLEDLVLDLDRGCVAYAVMSFGGLLGLGDRLFVMPWQALTFDSRKECFVLDIDREMLEHAPGFTREFPSDQIDTENLRGVYIFYGQSPYWEQP